MSSSKTKTGRNREGIFTGKLAPLRNLQLNDGELVFDPEDLDRGLLLDMIDYLENPVFDDNDTEKNATKVLMEISSQNNDRSSLTFDLPSFENQRQDYSFLTEKIKNGVEWAKSNIRCINCKQMTVNFFEKQTRSADESATIFYQCQECGKRWRKG